MVIILKKKFFADANILYENISEGIVFSWNNHKKSTFDLLDWRKKLLYILRFNEESNSSNSSKI